ncbi:uncharacterized protein LOC124143575 isoform X1 [Haliotis rufescens]|uniref:uncharacterized protein LOC124143575 isoform X1 n=2 Tax=Haliotis rufescens TaxID=6454 RepID=UPI00201ED4A0|nr:uncharacterized protein LOC124143575 isoform X1 [Haliotis rufescens]
MARFWSGVILCFTCFLITAEADVFNVVHFPDGRYAIQINGVTWLNSAPTFFVVNDTRFSTEDGSLLLDSINTTMSGWGPFGVWVATNFHYRAGDVPIVASISMSGVSVITFIVRFPDGVSNINQTNSDGVMCGFPGFQLDTTQKLGYMSFGGADITEQSVGRLGPSASFQDGLEGSSPFAVFDPSGNSVAFGQLDNVMTTPIWQNKTNNFLYYGIMGGIDQIPTNFSYQVAALYTSGGGPENSLSTWGFVIRSMIYKHDKTEDHTAKSLGYWTDEGAYYFDKTDGTSTYEDTLINVFSDARNRSIPYRYVELDTWWFTKGQGGGVKEWTAPTDIFPKGIEYVYRSLNVPIVAKNNFWSSDNIYATQNGGTFNFEIEGDMAIPTDETFWDKIFSESKQWGLATYIQDNMTEIFRTFPRMQTDLNFGRDWLVKMADSALRHNITIQYSGATPMMALMALQLPAVTQVRVQRGYGTGSDLSSIPVSSVFSQLLGISAFKDVFLTEDKKGDTGGISASRRSVEAVLSNGPVGIGDQIGHTNTSIVNRMCRADGTVLKPNNAALAIDAQVMQMAFQDGSGPNAEIWATVSGVYEGGSAPKQVYGIIFVSGLKNNFDITPTKAGIGYEYPVSKIFSAADPTKQYDFSDSKAFTIPPCQQDFCMYYASPVLKYKEREVLILGELNKWVPMSVNRVVNVTLGDVITVYVTGQSGETVEIWFADGVRFGALKTILGKDGQGSIIYEIKSHVHNSDLRTASTVSVVMGILATIMVRM